MVSLLSTIRLQNSDHPKSIQKVLLQEISVFFGFVVTWSTMDYAWFLRKFRHTSATTDLRNTLIRGTPGAFDHVIQGRAPELQKLPNHRYRFENYQ